jgi:hypothetical protein
MVRPLRIEYPGAVYLVIVRGNNRQAIFRDDGDRRVYLQASEGVKSFVDIFFLTGTFPPSPARCASNIRALSITSSTARQPAGGSTFGRGSAGS